MNIFKTSMGKKIFSILFVILLINFVYAIPTCSDTNEIDVSKIPCIGFTVSIGCSGNISVFNTTDADINTTLQTYLFADNVYNFTINLSQGGYELIDCENNSATVIVGNIEQGYGVNMLGLMFPLVLLSFISLFVSGRMFKKFGDHDEEEHEKLKGTNEEESFMPKSRLMPVVFMLFSFLPLIFMVGSINNYLTEYLVNSNVASFYGSFYILFSYLFYFIFLVSFIIWGSSFIKTRRVMRGLDGIE